MRQRLKPPEGQQCECPFHADYGGYDNEATPERDRLRRRLRKAFFTREHDKKLCYEWWCADCLEQWGEGEIEAWPVDERGRFVTPVRCQSVPGLD